MVRTDRGLSMQDLDEATGVTATFISRLERGLFSRPSAWDLARLSGPLGVDLLTQYRECLELPETMEGARQAGNTTPRADRAKASSSIRGRAEDCQNHGPYWVRQDYCCC